MEALAAGIVPRSPTPQGVGGLKCLCEVMNAHFNNTSHPTRGGWIEIILERLYREIRWSHPTRGGWIEIFSADDNYYQAEKSHPTRGGWIEIIAGKQTTENTESHPTRGGWIEISKSCTISPPTKVPPHKGWVD